MQHKTLSATLGIIGIMYFLVAISCTNPTSLKNSNLISNIGTLPDQVDFIFHVKPILSDRCFKCHGPDEAKVEAGLQLHTEEKAFAALGKDLDRFAIVHGDIKRSGIIERIYSNNPDDIMPPPESNLMLTEREKEILKKWVDQGAIWKDHWAFEQPRSPEIPRVLNEKWVSNPIDNFILHKLDKHNIQPTKPLSPEKLLRKLSFDLTGLPPSLGDIKAFREESSTQNYEALIDKYLASKAFAEQMTSQWLDLARYADTHGYQDDLERIMWPWRDWVIHAFDQNMPYDQFVSWQLAGDLIPDASKEQIIATAFNRNHKITQEGGVIPEEYRVEYVSDRTNTFGTAFLGLTFECAKCHDHKYDPISQKEYFQLFGYFNNIREKGLIETYGAVPEPYITLSKTEIEDVLTFINNIEESDSIPLMVMKELDVPRSNYILNRGQYNQLGEKIDLGLPSFGKNDNTPIAKDRLELANWLFSDDNPLTARVTVNRFWQHLFGKGIVSSSYDFGNQGSLPTHPELLDHLAIIFKDSDWDIKKMFKYIVSSSTYKQGNAMRPELLDLDPSNNLLARSTRSRLSAEMLRDHALSISGLLVSDVGGPSVKPYQPKGLWEEVAGGGSVTKYVQDKGPKNYRRSLYTFWKRTVPPPNMLLFDTPTRDFCMVQREQTSTPLQALVLMNDPQFLESSKALAHRAMNTIKSNENIEEEVIQYMFTLATSRKAEEDEISILLFMYEEQEQYFKNNTEEAQELLGFGEYELEEDQITSELAAYCFVANTIINLDETMRKT